MTYVKYCKNRYKCQCREKKTKQQDVSKSVAKSGSPWEQLTLESHVILLKSPSPVALALRWWFPVGSSQPFWRRDVVSPFVLRVILDTASLFQFDCRPQAVMGGIGGLTVLRGQLRMVQFVWVNLCWE